MAKLSSLKIKMGQIQYEKQRRELKLQVGVPRDLSCACCMIMVLDFPITSLLLFIISKSDFPAFQVFFLSWYAKWCHPFKKVKPYLSKKAAVLYFSRVSFSTLFACRVMCLQLLIHVNFNNSANISFLFVLLKSFQIKFLHLLIRLSRCELHAYVPRQHLWTLLCCGLFVVQTWVGGRGHWYLCVKGIFSPVPFL